MIDTKLSKSLLSSEFRLSQFHFNQRRNEGGGIQRGRGKGNPKGESNGNRMKRFTVEDMTFGALRILRRSGTAINRQKEVEEQAWDTFHSRNFVFAPLSTPPLPPFRGIRFQ